MGQRVGVLNGEIRRTPIHWPLIEIAVLHGAGWRSRGLEEVQPHAVHLHDDVCCRGPRQGVGIQNPANNPLQRRRPPWQINAVAGLMAGLRELLAWIQDTNVSITSREIGVDTDKGKECHVKKTEFVSSLKDLDPSYYC